MLFLFVCFVALGLPRSAVLKIVFGECGVLIGILVGRNEVGFFKRIDWLIDRVSGNDIAFKTCIKYLGVTIDQTVVCRFTNPLKCNQLAHLEQSDQWLSVLPTPWHVTNWLTLNSLLTVAVRFTNPLKCNQLAHLELSDQWLFRFTNTLTCNQLAHLELSAYSGDCDCVLCCVFVCLHTCCLLAFCCVTFDI